MSDEARRDVNNAIISAGSDTVGMIVDAARASREKREQLQRQRERRDAEEKAAREAQEKAAVGSLLKLSVA